MRLNINNPVIIAALMKVIFWQIRTDNPSLAVKILNGTPIAILPSQKTHFNSIIRSLPSQFPFQIMIFCLKYIAMDTTRLFAYLLSGLRR